MYWGDMGKMMKLHHLGIAVKNISKSYIIYKTLGFSQEGELIYDEDRNINILFINNGETRIELIEKASDEQKAPVDKFLNNRINHNIYHTCYSVSNLEKEIRRLMEENFVLMDEPAKAIAFGGKKVCFLYNQNVGMIELCEE